MNHPKKFIIYQERQMKLQFKALSVILGLVALLGTCTSVKSGTTDLAGSENSVEISPDGTELEASEDMETESLEASEDMETEGLEASEDMETEGLEASEDMETEGLEASEEVEDAELEASEEIEDAENAEVETPELEAAEESESLDQSSSIDSVEGTADGEVEALDENVEDTNSQF